MALSGKFIGGMLLAGGLAVIAIPSAELLSSQAKPGLVVTSDASQVTLAAGEDPVDAYVRTGKPLPSYISDAPEQAEVRTPTVRVVAPGAPDPAAAPLTVKQLVVPPTPPAATEVAAVPPAVVAPAVVAPIPYPASMRPKPRDPVIDTSFEAPVIVEDEVAVLPGTTPRPPAAIEPRYVPKSELEEWDSGSLAEYLERRGLMSEATYSEEPVGDYDADGFYLDEGPNNSRTFRSRSRGRDDGFYFIPD